MPDRGRAAHIRRLVKLYEGKVDPERLAAALTGQGYQGDRDDRLTDDPLLALFEFVSPQLAGREKSRRDKT